MSGSIRVAGESHGASDVVIDNVTGAAGDPDVLRNRKAQRELARQAGELVRGLLGDRQWDVQESLLRRFGTLNIAQSLVVPTLGESLVEQLGTSNIAGSLAAAMGTPSFAESLVTKLGLSSGVPEALKAAMGTPSFAESLVTKLGPSALGALCRESLASQIGGPAFNTAQNWWSKLGATDTADLSASDLVGRSIGSTTPGGDESHRPSDDRAAPTDGDSPR